MDTIDIVTKSTSPLYPLVWLKTFVRPILPHLYDLRFDNYTEHMQNINFGISTNSYADTNWAPNNLLFVDSILNFPNSVILQFLNSFILTYIYIQLSLRALNFVFQILFDNANYACILPLASIFFNGPTSFTQDTGIYHVSYNIHIL